MRGKRAFKIEEKAFFYHFERAFNDANNTNFFERLEFDFKYFIFGRNEGHKQKTKNRYEASKARIFTFNKIKQLGTHISLINHLRILTRKTHPQIRLKRLRKA